jgi:ribosomal protein S14
LIIRQALRYIIRNTLLPQRARAQAQLQLSQMHCYTRPTQIKNRCIAGGKGRGVFRDFRMARVCFTLHKTGHQKYSADVFSTVPIPHARLGGRTTWCEEGQLVKPSYFMSLYCTNIRDKEALGKALVGNQGIWVGFKISELHNLPSCLVADSSLFFPFFSIGC